MPTSQHLTRPSTLVSALAHPPPQSQRDCVPKPRVGLQHAGLPWVHPKTNSQPYQGCVPHGWTAQKAYPGRRPACDPNANAVAPTNPNGIASPSPGLDCGTQAYPGSTPKQLHNPIRVASPTALSSHAHLPPPAIPPSTPPTQPCLSHKPLSVQAAEGSGLLSELQLSLRTECACQPHRTSLTPPTLRAFRVSPLSPQALPTSHFPLPSPSYLPASSAACTPARSGCPSACRNHSLAISGSESTTPLAITSAPALRNRPSGNALTHFAASIGSRPPHPARPRPPTRLAPLDAPKRASHTRSGNSQVTPKPISRVL